jgi:uncharacterized damage-inducible protein DinB
MKTFGGIASFALFAGFALGQNSHSLVDLLVKHWQTSKTFTLAVANAMPEDQYAYKATEVEMSFGEMANQIADANMAYCSSAFGSKPGMKSTDYTKTAVVKHLSDSFDFCLAGLEKLSDTDLTKTVGQGGRQSTVFERLWGAFTHVAHHRGQLEVYLRLKGIAPPQYKF